MKKLIIAAASSGVFLLAACSHDSKDFKENAEAFVESTEVESQLDATFADASCTEPAKVEVDETFTCTATDADGEAWSFGMIIRSKDSYEVNFALPNNPEVFIESTRVESEAGTLFTDADCNEPATQDVGATFTCTAIDANGATWDFDLAVSADGAPYEFIGGAERV